MFGAIRTRTKKPDLWCENGQLDRQNKSNWETSLLIFNQKKKKKFITSHLEVHSFGLIFRDMECRETIAYITNHSLATETKVSYCCFHSLRALASEILLYPILLSQKATLSIIQYHFTIHLASRLLFSYSTH